MENRSGAGNPGGWTPRAEETYQPSQAAPIVLGKLDSSYLVFVLEAFAAFEEHQFCQASSWAQTADVPSLLPRGVCIRSFPGVHAKGTRSLPPPLRLPSGTPPVWVMEGLEVEDISPALEATEDYLHGPDGVQDDGQVRPPKLKEVSALDELSSSGVWGLLSGGQAEMSSHRLAWAEQTSSFGVLGLRSGKRNRARSTNDLAAHAKENNSTSNTSGGFKRGHNRSRSDVNNRTYMDNGVPAVDKNTLKNMALNNQQEGEASTAGFAEEAASTARTPQLSHVSTLCASSGPFHGREFELSFEALSEGICPVIPETGFHSAKAPDDAPLTKPAFSSHCPQLCSITGRGLAAKRAGVMEANKESSPSVVKQGVLDQREGAWGRWCACHVELTPCELRLYSLDSSGNRQLCTALSLSHCQAVGAPLPQDGRVLQALFFNSTRLQLRAPCQREALEWRRLLWERVVAARPARQQEEEPPAAQGPPRERASDARPPRPKALPLYTQRCPEALKAGVLYQLSDLNNWSAFTFVLGRTCLQAFPTEGRGPVSEPVMQYTLASCLAVQRDEAEGGGRARFQAVFPDEVLRLRAESELKAQDWVEALRAAVASQRTQADGGQPAAPGVLMRSRPTRERQQRGTQRAKRQSVTTSFLSILTCLAVEKGLTAQSFRCAGCQRLVGLSRGKAKVCCYSGWYYCQSCHQDNLFLIPARLLHNWDTNKHKVSKQAKEFLEFVYEEPLLDVQQLNPCLYEHAEPLATVLRLRQQLQSLRAYLFSCRATVAEDLRRRIFPREYLLQHIHLYSLADLQQGIARMHADLRTLAQTPCCTRGHVVRPASVQRASGLRAPSIYLGYTVPQGAMFVTGDPRALYIIIVAAAMACALALAHFDRWAVAIPRCLAVGFSAQVIDGKLAPFLSKVIKFASSHVYSCSLCREKGFVCELCQNGQILYPFQENATKRCEGCGAVFHAECRLRAQPCPRCVRRELHKKPSSFWRRHNRCDSPDDDLSGCFELDT
ncbi:hypothetical protein P4O66_008098 [Electrophorus voltai]|uniref:PH domain-containing protein n=1 Tax=Electrophorus voltai TaxID=2609070 RepID=A0AAD9DW74_9TELE|nr:hypothetical protein P4O66_008098 [Electrophorus voltai]